MAGTGRRWIHRLVVALLALIVVFLLLGWLAGGALSGPAHRPIGEAPAALAAQAVTMTTSSGTTVSGWWSPGEPGQGAVLLLHGVRGDRRQMLPRALFLHRQGRGTLLIDLPGHGESGGDVITFGARESEAVSAALRFITTQSPCEKQAVIGVSLGAASTVLAKNRPPLDAVVLESMFPTITDAVADRIRMNAGDWATALAPVLLVQLPLRLGISADDLRPIDHIAALGAPVLIASGEEDRHTTWPETQRLFDTASAPKQLWAIPGAAHVDLMGFTPDEYQQRITSFLVPALTGSRCATGR